MTVNIISVFHNQEAFLVSLYYDSKDRASKLANMFWNMFSGQNSDQNDNHFDSNSHYFQTRHLNQFGQIFSDGTRSPQEADTVYGRIIYKPEENNQTEDYSSVMFLEGKTLQRDGPTYATKTTTTPFIVPNLGFGHKFDNNENEATDEEEKIYPKKKDPIHKPPGFFGTPYTSIGPKQV